MKDAPYHPIASVHRDRLAGFHPEQTEAGVPFRWTETCAGAWLDIPSGVGEIRVRLLPDSRRLNVWQDLDVFVGRERLDHNHVDFDPSSGELVLVVPPRRGHAPGDRGTWLLILTEPHVIDGDPRPLGLPICGFRFPSGNDPAIDMAGRAGPGESFLCALAGVFHSDRYRSHLRRRMGTCAADWDERESHAQYDLSVHARLFASRRAELSFSMFMAGTGGLEFPFWSEPRLSIVVVTFNRAELTYQCLRSIREHVDGGYEVIVVDNGSTDRTAALLNRVRGPEVIFNEANTGFLKGANQGAARARGEFVLFLNNDTELLPGCCSAALETLRSDAGIGAVGARLVTFQGVLQEAGGIVWADGSTEHYGRGGRAGAGQYMFKRSVDYCSGAFLLTRTALFRSLGGFDEIFAPGYYEDTDFCLRLRESGYRTVYSPDSAVLHHEYASQGDGGASGIIDRNRAAFAARHASALSAAPARTREAIIHARSRDAPTRRVLYVGDILAQTSGATEEAVAPLLDRGCFVTLFASDRRPVRWEALRREFPDTVEIIPDVGWPQLGNFLADRRGYYDAVVVPESLDRKRFEAMVSAEEKARLPALATIDRVVADSQRDLRS